MDRKDRALIWENIKEFIKDFVGMAFILGVIYIIMWLIAIAEGV